MFAENLAPILILVTVLMVGIAVVSALWELIVMVFVGGAVLGVPTFGGVVFAHWLYGSPAEINWLAYPPQVARDFDPALAGLIGYCHHRPSIGMYDGQCPSLLLKGPVDDFIGTADAMNPGQEARIGRWLEIERSRRAA